MDCKNEPKKTCLAIVGMVSTILCFIFDMVGLVTDKWQTREDSDFNNSSKAGLWTCTNEMSDRDEGRMIASQVCGVIGAVMMAECMVMEGAMMKFKEFRKYGIWIFIALDGVGLFCMVTEVATYMSTTAMEAAELGYSSGVTILAFLLSIVGGVCCVLAYCDEAACKSSHYPVNEGQPKSTLPGIEMDTKSLMPPPKETVADDST